VKDDKVESNTLSTHIMTCRRVRKRVNKQTHRYSQVIRYNLSPSTSSLY